MSEIEKVTEASTAPETTPSADFASSPMTTTADATALASESKPEPAAAPPVAVEATTVLSEPAKTEAEEPQNTLTERFTTAEWNALKEFRVRAFSKSFERS